MARADATSSGKQLTKAAAFGSASAALYLVLFLAERPVLELSSRGGWYFLLPVAIAFAFSILHGAFTGYFWDALGIKAKK
jgi:hypothetical protein